MWLPLDAAAFLRLGHKLKESQVASGSERHSESFSETRSPGRRLCQPCLYCVALVMFCTSLFTDMLPDLTFSLHGLRVKTQGS